ncbi:MAG: hypothetical protein J6S06_03435, partial [Alphaproteobacteria bacterium]|nr:hypothetical protein [Alphaproteobacteria bacterium]
AVFTFMLYAAFCRAGCLFYHLAGESAVNHSCFCAMKYVIPISCTTYGVSAITIAEFIKKYNELYL